MARHVATKEQRNAVTVMAGLGTPANIIADGLRITVETLNKVYAKEIANGPDAVRLETMRQLFNAAKTDGAGRVTAAVKLIDLLAGNDKPADTAGAVRKSGLMPRLVTLGDRSVTAYDESGTQLLFISQDDDRL